MLTPDNLHQRHGLKRKEIEGRLAEFDALRSKSDTHLLSELAFCICAANSSAAAASRAQKGLEKHKLLFSDDAESISSILLSSHVRFHKNKARYIIEARKHMFETKGLEKAVEAHPKPSSLRYFLADEVLGLGM